MSTKHVKDEIKRFLTCAEAEVLCVRGKWGVGKTYAWIQFFSDIEQEHSLGLEKYAYVSLFGLNSLDDLRYAIFESTVTSDKILTGPDIGTLRAAIEKAGDTGRRAKPLLTPLLSAIGMKDAGEALSRAAFLSVRNQFVCLDDIERAGSSLELRDILGLASMLKEQRKCKVVLLLNDEQLEESNKLEFQKQLEKVVDVSLVFDPTPEEAVAISFTNKTEINQNLQPWIIKLDITNIRVIKKIERLAVQLEHLLRDFREEILDQAISTLALAGLSVFQPENNPTIKFIKAFNSVVSATAEEETEPGQKQSWQRLLQEYGYRFTNHLDIAILDGVSRGYFETEALLCAAQQIQDQIENDSSNNSLSKAWDLYHHSLTTDDDEILDAIYNGAMENLKTTSVLNINSAVYLLRDLGRKEQSSEVVNAFTAQFKDRPQVLEDDLDFLRGEALERELREAIDSLNANFVDRRDPKEVLEKIAENRSWNPADVALLASQSSDYFVKLFESLEGERVSKTISFAVKLGTHNGEDSKKLGIVVTNALKEIAAKSPLRARRVASYGVALD